MAKVILRPIGSSIEMATAAPDLAKNRERMEVLNRRLAERREEVRAGWGAR